MARTAMAVSTTMRIERFTLNSSVVPQRMNGGTHNITSRLLPTQEESSASLKKNTESLSPHFPSYGGPLSPKVIARSSHMKNELQAVTCPWELEIVQCQQSPNRRKQSARLWPYHLSAARRSGVAPDPRSVSCDSKRYRRRPAFNLRQVF